MSGDTESFKTAQKYRTGETAQGKEAGTFSAEKPGSMGKQNAVDSIKFPSNKRRFK